MFHSVQKHLQKIESWQVLHAVTNPHPPFKYHACSFLPDLCFSLQNSNYGEEERREKKKDISYPVLLSKRRTLALCN